MWPLLGTGSNSHKTQPSTTGGRKAATEKACTIKMARHPFPQKWLTHTALRPRLSMEQPLLCFPSNELQWLLRGTIRIPHPHFIHKEYLRVAVSMLERPL